MKTYKKFMQNNKCEIFALTWHDKFELPDGSYSESYQGRYIRSTTIFIFSFCIELVTQLNGSALGVSEHHYIAKRIRELLIYNSRFLIYNSLNQLL